MGGQGFCEGCEELIRRTVASSEAFPQALSAQAWKEISQGAEAQRDRSRIVPNGLRQIDSVALEAWILRSPKAARQTGTRLTSRKYSVEAKES